MAAVRRACAAAMWPLVLVCAQLAIMAALLYVMTHVLLPYHVPARTHTAAAAAAADAQNNMLLWHAAQVHLALAAVTYALLQWCGVVAPFGRHARASFPRALTLPARVAWLLQEVPTLLNVVYFLAYEQHAPSSRSAADAYVRHGGSSSSTTTRDSTRSGSVHAMVAALVTACASCRLGLLLFVVHYVQRSLIYPLRLPAHARRVPLHVVVAATLYCTFNGRLQTLANARPHAAASWSLHDRTRHVQHTSLASSSSLLSWPVCVSTALTVVGVALFVAGLVINVRADATLIALKRRSDDDYRIPRGGLFAYVSCPNFLGELVEWCGYAMVVAATCMYDSSDYNDNNSNSDKYNDSSDVAMQASVTRAAPALCAFSFVVYVAANLLPRASAHHAWYVTTFGDAYTRLQRRIVVPLIY